MQQSQSSLPGLAVRALALIGRRFALYAGAVCVAIAAQALVAFAWRVPNGLLYSDFIVPPLLTALTYAFVWADTGKEPPPARAIWERALERSWAVIVIDLAVNFLQLAGIAGFRDGNALDALSGAVILVLSATFVFADASATVDDMPAWWLIPGAFWRSIRAAADRTVFIRAIALVAIGMLAGLLQEPLFEWLQFAHVAHADFWSGVPLGAVSVPPIAALTALVYREAARPPGNDGREAS